MAGELQDKAASFRRRLLLLDEQVSNAMTVSYQPIYNRLVQELDNLLQRVDARKKDGEAVTTSWLYKEARLRETIQQVEREIERFAATATPAVVSNARASMQDAVVRAQDLIATSLGERPPEVPEEFLRFNRPTAETLSGQLRELTPISRLMASLAADQVEWLKQEFLMAVVAGDNPLVLARTVRQQLNIPLTRARTISRTTMLGAAREGALATYRSNSDVVKGWRWWASLSRTTCAMCLAMHGKEFPLDVPFGSHPNCRCSPIPVTKTWQELGFNIESSPEKFQTGQEWFDEQGEVLQDQILGIMAAEFYRSGKLSLQDFIGYRVDKEWGPTRWKRSLRQIELKQFKHPSTAKLERVEI